jgi:hypothetical protein|tara:strand:+ start:180 stop:1085 length:906 start_codon:yes stop_codon:yes gene_type:complete
MNSAEQRITDEWGKYVSASAFKSKYTISSYKNNHKRLTDYIQYPLHEAKPQEIIDAVHFLAENPNTKLSLLNTAIVFYTIHDVDGKLLLKEKNIIMDAVRSWKIMKDKAKGKILPTVDEIQLHLKSLYKEEKWRDFILMYLLINFNVRNKDLDVEIVDSIHKTKADKSRNYLVQRKNDIVYIRYSYKTFKTYGVKRNIFKSILVERAIRYLKAETPKDQPIYLIANEAGERLVESSIANYVKARTLRKLTESDYNKVFVTDIVDRADYEGLINLSNNRGTSLETLITSYNIPAEKIFPEHT